MFRRLQTALLLFLSLVLACPWVAYAQVDLSPVTSKPMVAGPDEEDISNQNGFAKPYDYERQALGYDPNGVIYHENEPEDFQIIFITSIPFVALASYCLTGLVSVISTGSFSVSGGFFWPFVGGVAVGSTTVACVSVLSNPYPPPQSDSIVEGPGIREALAFSVPLMTARF